MSTDAHDHDHDEVSTAECSDFLDRIVRLIDN